MKKIDWQKPITVGGKKRHFKAFTIVELLIVIAIIGILATIAAVGFSRYQAEARDAQRASKTTAIAESLEKYYDKNGEYPSCTAMTSDAATVSGSTLVGINIDALTTPKAAASDTNSIECTDLTGASGESDHYAYIGDPSIACTSGQACLQFTLKYREESTGNIITINSRRHTEISTSGTPVLTGSGTGFTTLTVNWTAVPNATNYTLEQASDSNFTVNDVTTPQNGASSNISGLTYNTTYYFRVRANTTSSVGTWSNVGNISTWSLTAPVLAATANSSSQITVNWPVVAHATNYTINYSTSSSFGSFSTATSATNSTIVTGLNGGTTYYFRALTTASGYSSGWSATANATTAAGGPSGSPSISAGLVSTNVARGTAGSAGSCPAGMSMAYQVRYHSTNTPYDGSWSGWYDGTTLDIGVWQGYKYTFQSQARCVGPNAASGYNASGTASTIRGIDSPGQPGWAIATDWAAGYNYRMAYSWSCPTGTSIGPEGVISNSGGADQSTPWVDWWYVGWNAGQYDTYHNYYARYRCTTPYSEAWSPTTTTQVHAYCDAGRRSFSSYPRCDKDGGGPPANGNGNY